MKANIKVFFIFFIIATNIISAPANRFRGFENNMDCYTLFLDNNSKFVSSELVRLSVDLNTRHQTIMGFGASDAWLAQPVGRDWNNITKEKIANWLFSLETSENGSPLGIGLSMWRFNLGAGSYEQGESSQISNPDTRTECFLDPFGEGSYNWNKQAGQQYFLRKAKASGVEHFVLFANSPPVSLTTNGKAWRSKTSSDYNLRDLNYYAYADFISNVLQHFRDEENINFSYISPVNEPQYDWTTSGDPPSASQEGTSCRNSQLKGLVSVLNNSLAAKNLNTKIMITEAAAWNYLNGNYLSFITPSGTHSQLDYFFNQTSGGDLRNLSHLPNEIGAHSYWTDRKDKEIKQNRENVYNTAVAYGIKLHQTEWCALNGNDNEGDVDGIPPYKTATPMDMALYLAKIIYADMKYAQVISWSYWTSLSVERYSQKNRFYLIRLRPEGGDYASVYNNDGTASADKNLWVLGNYSRFVRPGYQRVGLTGVDGTDGNEMSELMGTAYLAPDHSKVVVVLTNMSKESKSLTLNIPQVIENKVLHKNSNYLTNSYYNLSNRGVVDPANCTIPARSVQTIVFEYVDDKTALLQNEIKKAICVLQNNELKVRQISYGSLVQLYDITGRLVYNSIARSEVLSIPFFYQTGILKIITKNNIQALKFFAR